MIISFSVENWTSFKDKATFSMVASRERQHGKRVPKVGKYQTRILPVAAIYGGNASGKTNLFKALKFTKTLVTRGTQPDSLIPVEPFLLDSKSHDNAVRFQFELLIKEEVYEFSFAVTRHVVCEEKLVHVLSTRERVLYDRKADKIILDKKLENLPFLDFAFNGTRDNQLFLTNSVSQKVDIFKPVYDWFNDTLKLIAPDDRFEPFEQFLDEDHQLFSIMNLMIPQLDTGISRIGGEEIPFENINLPPALKSDLQENVKEGKPVRLLAQPINEQHIITRRNGKLVAKKLVTYHQRLDGSEAQFEMRQESDGSQRIIDLLPAFLDISSSNSTKVYVIDEIDRSLHSLLIRELLEGYLSKCSTETRAQVLFTTHDLLLMDQQLLRRDEMWIVERETTGGSNLLSFSEYEGIRYDKDIRKSYLQGRLGGIPKISLCDTQSNQCFEEIGRGNK